MSSLATARLTFTLPYVQGRKHSDPRNNKELSDDYEKRTWKSRMHLSDDPENPTVIIPSMALQAAVKEGAKYLSINIPGKGKATYTKHFGSGIRVLQDVDTGVRLEDVQPLEMFVPSNGVRGAGTRVYKTYPMILPPLTVEAEFLISDDIITARVFTDVLCQTGTLIGLGSFRIINQGNCGAFRVEGVKWRDYPGMTDEERDALIEYV